VRKLSLFLVLAVAACNGSSPTSSLPFGAAFDSAHHRVSSSPIQHVVIIMQENRSVDNLFYGFPGANTATTGLGHNGKVYTLTPLPLAYSHDVNHYHYQFLEDYDGKKNDGFEDQITSPPLNGKGCTNGNWFNEPHCWRFLTEKVWMQQPYTYAIQSQVQPYWDMATQYTLGDDMFASNSGPSFGSHQYLIAAQQGHASEVPSNYPWGCDAPAETENYIVFGQAKPPAFKPIVGHDIVGPDPCFPLNTTGASSTYTTMADELDGAGITWHYYVQPREVNGKIQDSFWLNAFDAVKAVRYGPDWTNGDISEPDTNVLTDITNGQLPQVSWVMPHGGASDHPGSGSGNCGPNWVASIVNEIGASQYWNNTAVIITWDEWGGWYDHVLPPQYKDPMSKAYEGLGYRVPLIVVSPYAKPAYISHKQHEVASTLHFIEEIFGLNPLGYGTPYKLADQRADGFDDIFDFTQPPNQFMPIKLVNEPPVKGEPACPTTSSGFVKHQWQDEEDY
jgi:phospholipase C